MGNFSHKESLSKDEEHWRTQNQFYLIFRILSKFPIRVFFFFYRFFEGVSDHLTSQECMAVFCVHITNDVFWSLWQGPPEAINICPLLVYLEASPGLRTVRTDLKLGGQKATTPYLRYVKDFQSTYTTFPYNKSKGHNVLTGIYDSFTAEIWSNLNYSS